MGRSKSLHHPSGQKAQTSSSRAAPPQQSPYGKQYSNESSNTAISSGQLDLVYLYADPIVKETGKGVEAVHSPLDLETEYRALKDNLRGIGKKFLIKKEAITYMSLQKIIKKNPKMIHISSHGAYDKEFKEFYLAIESCDNGLNVGMEDKFT